MIGERTAVIFGGSGFIGRHLITTLARQNYEVINADIVAPETPMSGSRWVRCDVRRPIDALQVFADDKASEIDVYNLAAVHRTPGHADREYYDTNVFGAIHVTEFCSTVRARRLVFTSSISVYGSCEDPRTESSAPTPETAYGASKLQAEHIHRAWQAADATRRLTIVRPAVIFGPGEKGNFTRLAAALSRRRFVYPGRKDTIKACGYVDELLRSIDFTNGLERSHFLYNFCYPTAYSIREICEAFHTEAGLPLPVGTVPYGSLRIVASALQRVSSFGIETGIRPERVDKLVRSTHVVPRALLDVGYTFASDLRSSIRAWHAHSNGELC
jgi:nucleoside-diphosphate-sugar epimerase